MGVTVKQKEGEKVYVSGEIVGYKMKYEDGVGYTLGLKFPGDEDNDAGIVIDFGDDNMADVKAVLEALEKAEPDVYVPDPEYEAHKKKVEETEKKWWKKIHMAIEDVGIAFSPFDWRLSSLFVTKPCTLGKGSEMGYKMCKGFRLGPLTVTW